MTNTRNRAASIGSIKKEDTCVRSASHLYFTTILGGLVTNTVKMQEVSAVLDVGCSEGGWVLDLARQYSRIHVTGIDTDEHALHESARFARFHGISNATFLPMDATASLRFKDNTFDLVHMRAAQFLYDSRFDGIMKEFIRILRPGGWINLVEFEPGATSSIAFDRLLHLFVHTIHTARKKTPAEAPTIGAGVQLYDILLNAYFLDVSYTVHAVDFSPTNILGAKAFVDEVLLAIRNVKALVCRLNSISPTEYDTLLAQAQEDMKRPDTCGYGYLISAVGCKNG
jgi:SAM-dependent methyltransferase